MTEVVFSKGLRTIGRSAFAHCDSLTEAYFHDGLNTIEGDAFFSCNALSLVRIPASVTEIGTDAFKSCSELTTVVVESPTIAKAATDPDAVGKLFCHPISILVGRSVTVLGAQIKSHYTAGKTVTENGISYTKYTYQPSADAEWYYDEAHHFLLCESGCDATLASQAHVLESARDDGCNVCAYETGASHSDPPIYVPVNGGHQAACEYCGEKLSSKVEAHDWGDTCRGEECYDCYATREAPGHRWGEWQSDAWEHYRECEGCGWSEKSYHVLAEDADPTVDNPCVVCGTMVLTDYVHTHTFGSRMKYDEQYHWQVCNSSNEIVDREEHHWNEGFLTLAPTTSREGERTFLCSDCDALRIESVPRLSNGSGTEGDGSEDPSDVTTSVVINGGAVQSPQNGSDALDSETEPSPDGQSIWIVPLVGGGALLLLGAAVFLIIKKKKKAG
ncbi:MAG: leucine-rich repeat domain-containing protein [Clostridia bacterium]|nr:leucine-rich repeat domain-containing protein [Clostridia bacterium]